MSDERKKTGPKLPPGEMRAKVRELWEAGFNQREIAGLLSVSKTTVIYHVRRFGVPVDDRFGRRYDWAEIQKAHDAGMSVRECAKQFGFHVGSWAGAVRRGHIVPRPQAMPIEELLVIGRKTSRGHLKQRLLREGLKENRCETCGITEWEGERLSMALHHLNGDGRDNRIENIVFLCPNCHAQTPNYGGRNGHRKRRSLNGDGGDDRD